MIGAVVVPTFGRGELLAACLTSLVALDPPPRLIVVVDGNEEPAPLPPGLPDWVEVVREPNQGPSHARNTGLARVRDKVDVVCFLDDDATAPTDWYGKHLQVHAENPRAGAVGGPLRNSSGPSLLARYAEACLFDYGTAHGPVRTVASANYSVKVRCLDEVGAFREDLWAHEDVELNRRIRTLGWEVHFDPALAVGHRYVTRLRPFLRQQRSYGRGFAKVRSEFEDLPGAELMRRSWPGAVAGTVPDAIRESARAVRAVGWSGAPVGALRQVVFRSAALAERRRLERGSLDQ